MENTNRPDYEVKITGPGGCINNVLAVIQKALQDAGFTVTVDNDHPIEKSLEDRLAFVQTLKDKGSVGIEMRHVPWGG